MPKIVFICPDDQSILTLCNELINVLKRERFDVYTIGEVENYHDEIRSIGVTHIQISMNRYISPLSDLRYLFSLYKIFSREKFDIVLNFTTKPNIYGTIAARLAGVDKIVCAIRGLGAPFVQNVGIKTRVLKAIITKLYRFACGLSSKVWFTNKNDLVFFLSSGLVTPQKIILSKNCVNIHKFSPLSENKDKLRTLRHELALSDNDHVVVMVARLLWAKGIREFIGAAEILKGKYPSAKFILVGPLENGNLASVPEMYLKEKEKIGNFRWIGFRKDVKDIYALSDIAVLPSYYKEGGFPRGLLEAMAMGKPVVAADTADCRGPVEDGENGFLIPVKNSVEVAKKVEVLLKNKNMREKFGRNSFAKIGKEFNERIVLRGIANEIKSLYKSKS